MHRQRIGATLLAACVVAPLTAQAQTDYWKGGSANWDVASDWTLGAPTSAEDVENDTSGIITFSQAMVLINSFLNTSTGGFKLTGGTLSTTTFFKNTGTGSITLSGGTLNVGGDFINANTGGVTVSGATLNVTGNFTNSGTGTLTFSSGSTTIGGNFTSAGKLNLTGGTLSGSGAATSSIEVDNTFLLKNATLQNFTVKNSSTINIQNGQLNNVILDGGLTLNTNNTSAYIGDGVTFGTTTPTTINKSGTLNFNGTTNPTFNTELIFGNIFNNGVTYNPNILNSNTPILTLGSNAFIHGNIGGIGYTPYDGPSGTTLINNGTIDADVSGGSIEIQPNAFTNNGILKADAGSLDIDATNWTYGGTLQTSNKGAIYLGGTLNNAGTIFNPLTAATGTDNVILSGTLSGGHLINSNSLQIQGGTLTNIIMDGGLTLNSGYTAYIGDGVTFGIATPTTISKNSVLNFFGSTNPTFNTELIFGDNSGDNSLVSNAPIDSNSPVLTLGSNALVHGNSGYIGVAPGIGQTTASLTNNGTIDADVSGGTITIQPTSFTNNGALKADAGTLDIEATNWTNTGTLETSKTGTIDLGGTLDNTGHTFDLLSTVAGTHNAILIGTLTGGNLNHSSLLGIYNGQFSNITLDGGLTVNGGEATYAYIGDRVTFGTATPTTISNSSGLYFNGTTNPTFNTELIFGDSNYYNSLGANTPVLTLGSTALVHGNTGSIGYSPWQGTTASVINNGTIDADVNGGTITIQPTSFTNNGALKADNGGILDIAGAWTNHGTIAVSNSGSIVLTGTLSGTLNHSNLLSISNGTLTNVTLDGGLTVNSGEATYAYIGDGVTFGTATPTTISNGSGLNFNGTTNPTFNSELIFGDSNYYNSLISNTPVLTLGSNALVHGNTGFVGYSVWVGPTASVINNGTIDADVNGGTITIQPTSFTNNGALKADNGGTLNISSTTSILNGSMTATGAVSAIYLGGAITLAHNYVFNSSNGGAIYLNSNLNNGGNAFTTASGALTLNGVTLQNAIVNVSGTGTGLAFAPYTSNTLNNVTVNSDLTLDNGYPTYAPTSLAVSGTTTIGDNVGYGYLVFNNATASSTTGIANILLGGNNNADYSGYIEQTGGNTLTISSSTTVHGFSGYIGDLASGTSDTLINQGTLSSDVSGGSINVDNKTFTNSGTLSALNGGTVNLNGTTTKFTGGLVDVATGGAINTNASVTQTGGTTTVDGSLNLPSGKSLLLQGGLLTGTGTLTGSVSNSAGTLRPGDLLGTLAITGNYTQSGTGKTEIDLGGATQGVSYDQLAVTNSATLTGELDVKLVDNFTPTVGETFDFLTYGSHSGSFTDIMPLNMGFTYTVSYASHEAILTVATVAGVPESSTLTTAGLILGAGGWLLLRRRERKQPGQQKAA